MKIYDVAQRSPEWFAIREGKLSASIIGKVIAGTTSAWQRVIDSIEGRSEPITQNYAMSRGIELEPVALANYELLNPLANIVQVGFVVHEQYDWIGASPDGMIAPNGGIEIKCPFNQEKHFATIATGMPDYHTAQVQANIWVCEAEWWDFVSFDPRLDDPKERFYCERIYRDDKYIAYMEKRCLSFRDFWLGSQEVLVAKATEVPKFF